MKRSLITLLLLALCCLAQGQEGRPKSGPVLQGEVIPESRLVETLVKGRDIEDLGLTLFHSVRFTATPEELATVSRLVLEDAAGALTRRTVLSSGLLQSAFLQTSRSGYLALQSKPSGNGQYAVILVYMEGHVTEKQLRQMFGKN